MYGIKQRVQTYFSSLSGKIEEAWKYIQDRRFLKQNNWNGLKPGDVIEYDGRTLMYRCIDPRGAPGLQNLPAPQFVDVTNLSQGDFSLFYMYYPNALNLKSSAKVDHITPEQWNDMVIKVNAELSGQTT